MHYFAGTEDLSLITDRTTSKIILCLQFRLMEAKQSVSKKPNVFPQEEQGLSEKPSVFSQTGEIIEKISIISHKQGVSEKPSALSQGQNDHRAKDPEIEIVGKG